MYSTFILLGVVSAVLAAPITIWKPECRHGEKYEVVPKPDCTGFYMCVWGVPIEMPDCPPEAVFSRKHFICVLKGSSLDDCTPTPTPPPTTAEPTTSPPSIEEQCAAGADIIPHPTECQLYYNCSAPYINVPRYFEQYLHECKYPELFSLETMKCEHFENVKCGARKEHKNACEYISNMCPVAHCIPCSVRFPSCDGLPNGPNPSGMKLWSPYFAICYKERALAELQCGRDADNRPYIFSPDASRCVSLDEVPRQHGGTQSECEANATGYFLDTFGRCDRYYRCENGIYEGTKRCPVDEVFDVASGVCQSAEDACAPCGLRKDCKSKSW